jgi:ribosomal protein S18 acetylase RimI-like enzyme
MPKVAQKEPVPTVSWMKKAHFPDVLAIEEKLRAWEGWSQKVFMENLRDKQTIGVVVEIQWVVVGFSIYKIEENQINIMKFDVTPEFSYTSSRAAHVLIQNIVKKAKDYNKNVVAVFPEDNSDLEKYKFFAKEGFSSKLLRNFFHKTHDEYEDGYQFSYKNV